MSLIATNNKKVDKHIIKLYDKAYKIFTDNLLTLAPIVIDDLFDELNTLGYSYSTDIDFKITSSWLGKWLEEYNSTTKYVFNNELQRKKDRLCEALISIALADGSILGQISVETEKEYKTSFKLLSRQIGQYFIEYEDRIQRDLYEEIGVDKVKWVTEKDKKVCSVCEELDEQIFTLSEVPEKQHHNCRCYIVPININ